MKMNEGFEDEGFDDEGFEPQQMSIGDLEVFAYGGMLAKTMHSSSTIEMESLIRMARQVMDMRAERIESMDYYEEVYEEGYEEGYDN